MARILILVAFATGVLLAGCAHHRAAATDPASLRGERTPHFTPFSFAPDTVSGNGTLVVVNSTDWEIEVLLEVIGTQRTYRRLGLLRPDSSEAFASVPAGIWIALRARTLDGSRELDLPASRFTRGETRHWPISSQDWWKPVVSR